MKLNHNIYEEAMDNVTLSDETGMRLLEQAAYRKQQRGQKWKLRVAAVVAAILTIGISLNGICYAQTGRTALQMFLFMYENGDMEEVATLARETRPCGESITDENMRFTLDYYWYDRENMEAFFAVRMESLDGTKLDEEEVRERYYILPQAYFASSFSDDYEIIGDGTSLMAYYYTSDAYDELGNQVENMSIKIGKFQADMEIGTFELEPTGQARARYADFDGLEKGSMQFRITGAGFKAFLSDIWDMENKTSPHDIMDEENKPFREIDEENKPFRVIDVVMKDGTVYRADIGKFFSVPDGEVKIENVAEEENIRDCEWGSFFSSLNNWDVYSVSFHDYINVDNIAGVYVDGVELTLR